MGGDSLIMLNGFSDGRRVNMRPVACAGTVLCLPGAACALLLPDKDLSANVFALCDVLPVCGYPF